MAKFEKGHEKRAGRAKGTPNRTTRKHRDMISLFLDEVATPEKMVELYQDLFPREKAQFLTKLFQFVIPRMEAHEISQEMTPEDAREILTAILEERRKHDTD